MSTGQIASPGDLKASASVVADEDVAEEIGTFHAFCPPHYPTMADAVEAFAERKFGPGGPYHRDTPGAWNESAMIRSPSGAIATLEAGSRSDSKRVSSVAARPPAPTTIENAVAMP